MAVPFFVDPDPTPEAGSPEPPPNLRAEKPQPSAGAKTPQPAPAPAPLLFGPGLDVGKSGWKVLEGYCCFSFSFWLGRVKGNLKMR